MLQFLVCDWVSYTMSALKRRKAHLSRWRNTSCVVACTLGALAGALGRTVTLGMEAAWGWGESVHII